MGGEQSERQWRDIVGILRLTGDAIDRATLLGAAREFEVEGLLERAWKDAGGVISLCPKHTKRDSRQEAG
jgi:hypothetical protein